MANKKVSEVLGARFERRQRIMAGRVTQVPNVDGRSLGYIICEVAGQKGVRVSVNDPNMKYYVGDTLEITEMGTPVNASYRVSGFINGPRPDSGIFEFTDTATIGTHTYSAGDTLFGNPLGGNWLFDYESGAMLLRTQDQINGIIDNEGVIDFGPATGVHSRFSASALEFMYGDKVVSAWIGNERTIYGVENWGRPMGPGISTREFIDDEGQQRYGMQIIGYNGVPGISLLTGTENDPDDYRFYIGRVNADARFAYERGDVTITGHFYQKGGNLDGWEGIGRDGGIYQGSFAPGASDPATSPCTGIKIWNDGGIGRLTTYKNAEVQVELDTEGQLLWAAGAGVANASGMRLSATIPDMFVTPLGGIGIAENYIKNTNILNGWEGAYSSVSALGNDTYAVDFSPVFILGWIRIAASSYGNKFGFWVRNLEGWDGKIRWGVSQGSFGLGGEDPFTLGENASALISPSVWTYVEADVPSASWLSSASEQVYYYIATNGLDSTEYFEVKNPHAYTSLGDVSPNFLKTAGYSRTVDGIWATGDRPLIVTASTLGVDVVSSGSGARIIAASGTTLELSASSSEYGQKITSGSGLIAYSPFGHYIHINPGTALTLYPSQRIVGVADAISGSDAISLAFGDARYAAASSIGGGSSIAASSILNNVATFNGILSASHTSVQLALDALDDHLHAIYAPSSCGVTGGNTHNHSASDGGQISYNSLSNLPTLAGSSGSSYAVTAPSVSFFSDNLESGSSNFTSSGDVQWQLSSALARSGSYSLRSGSITADQVSSLHLTISPSVFSRLSFWYQVSSEADADAANLVIDGVFQKSFSGTVTTWTRFSADLAPGTHAVMWSYSKDSSTNTGSDCMFVDDVSVDEYPALLEVLDGRINIGSPSPAINAMLNVEGNVNLDGQLMLSGCVVLAINSFSTFVGRNAGGSSKNGRSSTIVGYSAGGSGIGDNNVWIGRSAGVGQVAGFKNVGLGSFVFQHLRSGQYNIGMGYLAGGQSSASYNFNVFLGGLAGYGMTAGDNNIFIGQRSAFAKTSGCNNVFVGFYSGYNNTAGSGNVFIGYKAGENEANSDRLYIQNATGASPLIFGIFTGASAGVKFNSQSASGVVHTIHGVPGQLGALSLWEDSQSASLLQVTASGQIISALTASAPFVVASSVLVTNLNADKLDGYDASQLSLADPPLVIPVITYNATNFNSSTTYYWGVHAGMSPQANATWSKVRAPRAGRITRADIMWYASTPSSAGSTAMYVRVGNTTDYLIANLDTTANSVEFSASGMSASIAAGDWFVIKMVTPAWATCPANIRLGGTVYLEAL